MDPHLTWGWCSNKGVHRSYSHNTRWEGSHWLLFLLNSLLFKPQNAENRTLSYNKSISAPRHSWFVVRPFTVSVVPLDSSQLLMGKVVPDQGKQREKPSTVLSHLRLPLPSWDLGIRQKRQSLRSPPF